jgi:hypothetical protein
MEHTSPIMKVGRYAGKRVDSLPGSYLRWVVSQKFSKDIMDAANHKLKQSDYFDLYLHVSRHAIDMYSKRFLFRWMKLEHIQDGQPKEGDGIATHVAKEAQIAWEKGVDVSKNRHVDDGIRKLHDGLLWVFNVNQEYPDYKDVITVMGQYDA